MTEGRGSEGREVKYQHWKAPENQLSQTLFLLSRNTLNRFVWEARILHLRILLEDLAVKEGPCGHAHWGHGSEIMPAPTTFQGLSISTYACLSQFSSKSYEMVKLTFTSPVEVGGTTVHPTFRTKALNPPATKLKVHMNDLQLQGVSWHKDLPPSLPCGHSFPGGIWSVLGYKAPALWPQFGATLKGHPSSRALCGITRGLCYDSLVVQLLSWPNGASFTSLLTLFLRACLHPTPCKSAACR